MACNWESLRSAIDQSVHYMLCDTVLGYKCLKYMNLKKYIYIYIYIYNIYIYIYIYIYYIYIYIYMRCMTVKKV